MRLYSVYNNLGIALSYNDSIRPWTAKGFE